MHFILRCVIGAIALYITVVIGKAIGLHLYLDQGIQGIEGALLFAVAIGIVNAVIRPVIKLIALPITCLTLGLFGLVINAALFWTVGQFIPGFHVSGFRSALFGTVVMSFVGAILGHFVASDREREPRDAVRE